MTRAFCRYSCSDSIYGRCSRSRTWSSFNGYRYNSDITMSSNISNLTYNCRNCCSRVGIFDELYVSTRCRNGCMGNYTTSSSADMDGVSGYILKNYGICRTYKRTFNAYMGRDPANYYGFSMIYLRFFLNNFFKYCISYIMIIRYYKRYIRYCVFTYSMSNDTIFTSYYLRLDGCMGNN